MRGLLSYMTVPANTRDHLIHDMFSMFSNGVHILGMIPATLCSAERSPSALRRVKTYLSSTMGQKRVSNIAFINTERAYANSEVNNDMDRSITDIFGRQNAKDN